MVTRNGSKRYVTYLGGEEPVAEHSEEERAATDAQDEGLQRLATAPVTVSNESFDEGVELEHRSRRRPPATRYSTGNGK